MAKFDQENNVNLIQKENGDLDLIEGFQDSLDSLKEQFDPLSAERILEDPAIYYRFTDELEVSQKKWGNIVSVCRKLSYSDNFCFLLDWDTIQFFIEDDRVRDLDLLRAEIEQEILSGSSNNDSFVNVPRNVAMNHFLFNSCYKYAIPLGTFIELLKYLSSFFSTRSYDDIEKILSTTNNKISPEETLDIISETLFPDDLENDLNQNRLRRYRLSVEQGIYEKLIGIIDNDKFQGVYCDFIPEDRGLFFKLLNSNFPLKKDESPRSRNNYFDAINLAVVLRGIKQFEELTNKAGGVQKEELCILLTNTSPVLALSKALCSFNTRLKISRELISGYINHKYWLAIRPEQCIAPIELGLDTDPFAGVAHATDIVTELGNLSNSLERLNEIQGGFGMGFGRGSKGFQETEKERINTLLKNLVYHRIEKIDATQQSMDLDFYRNNNAQEELEIDYEVNNDACTGIIVDRA